MPSNFYDLLKYAKTGIASPEMTHFDKMRALAMAGGGTVQTLTGIPPLTFKANGRPLTSLSILGNGQQTGTPTPDNPIMPEFVGERTANLFDWSAVTTGHRIAWATGVLIEDASAIMSDFIQVSRGTYRTNVSVIMLGYDSSKAYVGTYNPSTTKFKKEFGNKTTYFNIPVEVTYVRLLSFSATDTSLSASTMLNTGATALPYEPYGYKIPITCAGQTVPVYLGQTQTVRKIGKKSFDGTEAWRKSTNFPGGFFIPWTLVGGMSASPARCTHAYAVPNTQSYVYGAFLSDANNFNIRIMQPGTELTEWRQFLSDQYAAGTPVTIWYVLATPTTNIINEPLAKIGDYADELHSEDAGVMIPTTRGQNVLTVDTDLQPSEMTITYNK